MTGNEYLVLGASGKTGSRAVRLLRDRGVSVRAASRSSATRFDWQDPDTWAPALEGVTGVYLVVPHDPAWLDGFVEAMENAGVQRAVLLSSRNLEGNYLFEASMEVAETALQQSSLEWTIVRANFFMQNFSEEFLLPPVEAGRVALPTGGTPEAFIHAADIAAVMVAALLEDGHASKVYEISGPEAITYADAVAQIAEASGRSVVYQELTPEAYEQELAAAGYDRETIAEFNDLWKSVRDGLYSEVTDTVRQVTGREPISFRDYLAEVVAEKRVWR